MGQKVNPHGLRVGVIKDWDSRWYARPDKVGDLIVEDDKIRKFLKKKLYAAGVPTIEIERDSAKVRIFIHCSRPGVVIGKGGAEIERLQNEVSKMIGKPVAISIIEVRTPDMNAQLVAENNFEMDPEKLYVCETYAGAGPILKRGMPRAKGSMYRINKRTSHIMIAVAERD